MKTSPVKLKQLATFTAAWAVVILLYAFMKQPELSGEERLALASEYRFSQFPLPELAGYPHQTVRKVHPSLMRIDGWISSVGAAALLADLDGDGLPNDLCHIDPRDNQATLSPVPGTGDRYPAFGLNFSTIPYDAATMAPMGCVGGDFNEDGKTDLLVYFWGRTPALFFNVNQTGGLNPASFSAQELLPGGERWFSQAATLADIDGDGHVDILVGNYFQDGGHILEANGTGVEVMHNTKSKSFNGGAKHVFVWTGASQGASPQARYREVAGLFDAEINHGWTLAMGAQDLDGDLLPELYFGHDFGPDRLLHNRSKPGQPQFALLAGKGGFSTPKSFVLGQDSFKGMGVDFGDLNDDGIPDIYVSNIASEFALQESHLLWQSNGDAKLMAEGIAPYEQASEKLGLSRSGWGWDTKLNDMNNDGILEALQATGFMKGKVDRWPELQALGTGNDQMMDDPRHWPRFKPGDDVSGHEPNAFFARAGDGRFYNINKELGMADPVVTRGIAVADVDGDGDLDFVTANQWEASTFFRNDCPNCGAFLGLHLRLKGAREAVEHRLGHPDKTTLGWIPVGAQATVTLPDGRKLKAQVDGGNGHSGRRSPDLHFGLGKQQGEVDVELRWRGTDGQTHRQNLRLQTGWHTVQLG